MRSVVLTVVLLGSFGAAAGKDVEGAKDHPLLTRMPGSVITKYEQKDFDSVDMSAYLQGADGRWDGKKTELAYQTPEGAQRPSMVQIARNYENALKKAGAKILSADDRTVLAKLEKSGAVARVFVAAFNEGAEYTVLIVEEAVMEQAVVADAATLKKGLAAEGRIALYGIYFDTGKAVVKPESAPTLEQVVKLLKGEPKLQLFVVGHTDGTAQLETNLKLSADRAAAVVKELVARGVDGARLKPAGVGPYSPVASNRTEEGKAKNRRVELVDRL